MELEGFEPSTPCMPCRCSAELSYSPIGKSDCNKLYRVSPPLGGKYRHRSQGLSVPPPGGKYRHRSEAEVG